MQERTTAEDKSRIISSSPNAVVVEATLARCGWVVLLDNWYPGWEAWVDGGNGPRRVPVLRANYAFRAVALPPGNHQIHFRYRPPSFRIGLWLSIAAWILWAGGIVRVRFATAPKEES